MKFEDGKIKEKPKIYLAGPIENEYGFGKEWRETFTPFLRNMGFEVINPLLVEKEETGMSTEEILSLRYSDFDKFTEVMEKVVKKDLEMIKSCSVVIANVSEVHSNGTAGEITYCYANNIPVILYVDPAVGFENVSGWLLGCASAKSYTIKTTLKKVKMLFEEHSKKRIMDLPFE